MESGCQAGMELEPLNRKDSGDRMRRGDSRCDMSLLQDPFPDTTQGNEAGSVGGGHRGDGIKWLESYVPDGTKEEPRV